MPPKRRRIGPRNPRAAANRGQAGVTPYRTIREQQQYGGGVQPPIASEAARVNSRPGYSRAQINAVIDAASQNLSPEKRQALRRAHWLWDAEELLTIRPTNTSYPPRPRTLAAGYDEQSRTLFVRFRGQRTGPEQYADGIGYEYYNVSPQEWARYRDNWSPGRYINAVLNDKPYTPATW